VNNIRIEKVATRKDRKIFVYFPWKVYKNDPNWIPPSVLDFKEKINKEKNPLNKEELWIM
jgi:hypothetical protein